MGLYLWRLSVRGAEAKRLSVIRAGPLLGTISVVNVSINLSLLKKTDKISLSYNVGKTPLTNSNL